MSSRQQRRRQSRSNEPPPIIGRTEIVAAGVVFAAAAVTLGVVFLISSGGDDDDATAGDPTQAIGTPTGAAFVPDSDDGRAILELGRRSVEALPNGQWPELYDSFAQDFRDRCPREEFVAAGEADAAAQGDRLQELAFVKLINVEVAGTTATAVIVGALGAEEYSIGTSYEMEDGQWKISPPPETAGCNGFTRLG